jgi:hypothetical protein
MINALNIAYRNEIQALIYFLRIITLKNFYFKLHYIKFVSYNN